MIPFELPKLEAHWWPVFMETIPGSGEKISVATVVRAASGQSQIRQSISPSLISALFGTSAKGMSSMLAASLIEIQQQLNAGRRVEELEFPFGGFFLGACKECIGKDLNEIFDVSVRLSTAFGQSNYGVRSEISDSSKLAFRDWAEKIKKDLFSLESPALYHHDFTKDFNVPLKVGGKSIKIGFLKGSYAANFGVMRPGVSSSADTRSLKAKVFDLEAVNRSNMFSVLNTELLVGCPNVETLSYLSNKERNNFIDSLEFLEKESKARHVSFIKFESHLQAAHHLSSKIYVKA
ncbi:hypothetical protein [Limnobacter parvus]|nr:hypothetical protein [Limnobacter parvus]